MISMITRIRIYQTIREKAGDLCLGFYPASRPFSENPLNKGGIGQGRGLGPLDDTETEMENIRSTLVAESIQVPPIYKIT